MNGSRVKKIKNMIRVNNPDIPEKSTHPDIITIKKIFRNIKKRKKKESIRANIPIELKPISKKIHSSESVSKFKIRRFECNKRRRLREKSV